jgi:hypothetical protein
MPSQEIFTTPMNGGVKKPWTDFLRLRHLIKGQVMTDKATC